MTEKCFVVEITPVVADDGSTQTFLFGTQAFATKPTDTPANTSVRPFLKNPGSLRRELFSGARVTGAIKPSYGNIVLANPAPDEDSAGELDAWFDYGLSGSKVVVRYGTIGDDYPSAWTTVYIAYAQSFVADLNEITIRLRDRLQLLEQPIVADGFDGTGGLEGNGGIAKKKQFVAGEPGWFPPILIDVNRQIYFVQSTSDGGRGRLAIGILNTFQAFDNGINLTRQTPNYTSESELLNSPPSQGFVKFYCGPDSTFFSGPLGWKTGPVYMRLGSPPAGDLRVFGRGFPTDEDFNAYGGTVPVFTAGVLALRTGLQKTDLEDSAETLKIGSLFVDDNSSYNDVLADACLTFQGWYGFTRVDKFRSGNLNDPNDDGYYYGVDPSLFETAPALQPTTSKFEFNTSNIQNLRREPVNGMEAPIWKVSVKAGQTWPSQIANGAISQVRDIFTRNVWTAFQGVSTTALLQNPGAITTDIEIRGRNIINQRDVRLWLERYFVLYGGRRDFYTFITPMTDETLNLELANVVTLKTSRFGLSAGKKFRIVGIEIQANSNKGPTIKFTLWGGEIGKLTGYTGGPGSRPYYPPNQQPSIVNPSFLQSQMGDFSGDFAGSVATPSASTAGSEASYMGDFISQFFGEVATSVVCDHDFADVTLLLHFDGSNNSTTFTDSSSYARTVTRNGDTKISTTQSKFGGASGYFDGTGDFLSITNGDFVFTGDFTIELWVYPTSVSVKDRSLVRIGNESTNRYVFYINSSGQITGNEYGQNVYSYFGSISINTWTHLTFVRSSNVISVFSNGIKSNTTVNYSKTIGNNGYLSIGPDFVGYLDDLRITKGVARYTSNFTVPSAAYPDEICYSFSLVNLLLHFNGANNSTTFTDSSSYNRTVSVFGNTKINTAQSKFGESSGLFDGNGDYLIASSISSNVLGKGDFTVEFWIYPNNTSSGYRALVASENYNPTTTGGWCIYQNGTSIEIWLSPGTSTSLITAPFAITATTWQHIALSRSSGTVRLFVNGTDVGSAFNSIEWTGQTIYIGDNNYSATNYFFNGYIDELRIIKSFAMYTTNFTPPTAPFPDS